MRHMLINKAVENAIAKHPLYSQDGKGENAKVIVKFFFGAYTWYVLEGRKEENGDYLFFGIIDNAAYGEHEYGYFTLSQLTEIKHWGIPAVERDMYFGNKKVGDLELS